MQIENKPKKKKKEMSETVMPPPHSEYTFE